MIVDHESKVAQFEEFRAKYLRVQFIANLVNSGFAYCCNHSVAQASGEQLLFMNRMSSPAATPQTSRWNDRCI